MTTLPFGTTGEIAESIPVIVNHLRSGGVLAYPTETVYGLGCLLEDRPLRQLAAAKGRSDDKPFLVLVGTKDDLQGVSWPESARRLASHFWPGPLTLALPAVEGVFHPRVVGPGGTVAVRCTSHPGVRQLLLALRAPLTSTSANAPGEPSALTAAEAAAVLQHAGAVDALILDGGTLDPSKPSTLVDCSVEPPRLIREGVISRSELAAIIPLNG